MFKKLFSWWKEDILLKSALEESALALEKAGEMFSFAIAVLFDGESDANCIYEMDKEVNDLQIDVRKKILQHLTINPEQDVTASLVLTTIVVDIERIGDIAKNIIELDTMVAGTWRETKYLSEIKNIKTCLDESMRKAKDTFLDADIDKARELMEEFTWVAHKCDDNLKLLVGDDTLEVREAVVYGLLFRYLKRTGAHARNIASSVVNPFHRLGFKPN